MKKYFIFILLLSVLLLNAVDKKKTGWEESGLKGKVKEYTVIYYTLTEKFGEMEKKQWYKIIYKYDDKGNKIEQASYTYGSLDYKDIYKYIYDDKGNKIEEAKYLYEEEFGEQVERLGKFIEYQYIYYDN